MPEGSGPEPTPAAAAILAIHIGEDGWCKGCLDQWARLIPQPCTHAEWANRVAESSGPSEHQNPISSLSAIFPYNRPKERPEP